jgi:hypothetical protein
MVTLPSNLNLYFVKPLKFGVIFVMGQSKWLIARGVRKKRNEFTLIIHDPQKKYM